MPSRNGFPAKCGACCRPVPEVAATLERKSGGLGALTIGGDVLRWRIRCANVAVWHGVLDRHHVFIGHKVGYRFFCHGGVGCLRVEDRPQSRGSDAAGVQSPVEAFCEVVEPAEASGPRGQHSTHCTWKARLEGLGCVRDLLCGAARGHLDRDAIVRDGHRSPVFAEGRPVRLCIEVYMDVVLLGGVDQLRHGHLPAKSSRTRSFIAAPWHARGCSV